MSEILLIIVGIIVIAGFAVLFLKLGKTGARDVVHEIEELQKQVGLLNHEKITIEERARMLQGQLDQHVLQLNDKDTSIKS